MSVQSVALLSSAALELVSTFAIAIAAAYIGCNLLRYILFGTGPTGMSLQTGLFLLLLAPAFFQPLRSFAAAYHDRADALAAVESLLPILSSSSENLSTPEESQQAVQELADVQSIELRQLSVHYTRQKNPTLQEVTLPLIRDQAIALTGESGSGKSTLLGVLAGSIQAASGDMLVNGEVLPPQTSVKTSWIGQRPYLFPGTLAENIALGQTEHTSEEMEIAARKAGVMSFAEKLPAGLDTQVGERGLGLSGGEAQRVALARAFLKKAPLLLLDEPTAHVDTETEEQLLASLAELVKGKFVVIATHSPTVLTLCKHIYHLEAGKLEQVSIPEEEASRA
jgi:ATP-binding cassette subfamily C protein CydD